MASTLGGLGTTYIGRYNRASAFHRPSFYGISSSCTEVPAAAIRRCCRAGPRYGYADERVDPAADRAWVYLQRASRDREDDDCADSSDGAELPECHWQRLRATAEPCEVCESCTEIKAGNAVDVIEIDAATNRGIDEIRELRDAARYRPARDKYKIYILDEAHQITDAAFNALLKTLEEPPDHIVFMMATTQPEDIPQTVRSRCQHFSFHAVKLVDILGELRGIAEREGVYADEAALSLLAEAGDGSMRDALSIMDQAIASAPMEDGWARLDAGQIRELMGTVPNAVFERILEAVNENRSAEVITVANELLDAGNSPAQLARQCVRYLRNCVIAKIAGIGVDGADADGLRVSCCRSRRMSSDGRGVRLRCLQKRS